MDLGSVKVEGVFLPSNLQLQTSVLSGSAALNKEEAKGAEHLILTSATNLFKSH